MGIKDARQDEEISAELEKAFRKRGIRIFTEATVESVKRDGAGAAVVFKDKSGASQNLAADGVLIAVRRSPRREIRPDFLGEQFALPIAVESLRAMRREPTAGEGVTIAADPLNLAGIIVPGGRVAANSDIFVTFRDGAVAEEPRPVTELSSAL